MNNNDKSMKHSIVLAAIGLAGAQAEIVTNSYWQSRLHNWSEGRMKIVDGIVEGSTDANTQFIQSSWSLTGHADENQLDIYENVRRVKRVFPVSKWLDFTQEANDIYTYRTFLMAVAKFPAFCGESNNYNSMNEDEICKREIAALFAHIGDSSANMSIIKDPACQYSVDDSCLYASRGPMALSGELDYKSFSDDFFEGYDRSDELDSDTDRVANDAYIGFSSAIWKYMQ